MTPRARRRFLGVLIPGSLTAAWAATIEGWFLRQPARVHALRADELAARRDADWEDTSITASDGVELRGWLFTPRIKKTRAVLLVHGGGGSRHGMLTRAEWHLKAGAMCLVVDQRGCGESGGVVTYGVREPDDLAGWARWLRQRSAAPVFGHGVSRGSTTLIQSLAYAPPLDGIAAECAGIGNVARPYEALSARSGWPEPVVRLATGAFIEPSLAWIRVRKGIDLRTAPRGLDAVRDSRVPVLLIQGAEDDVTPLAGAERMRAANPAHVELVVIRGVGHDWFARDQPIAQERIQQWLDQR